MRCSQLQFIFAIVTKTKKKNKKKYNNNNKGAKVNRSLLHVILHDKTEIIFFCK